jgi:small-conductance mechanosensitive channel/CRP-like cAMP-binding protein
MPTPLETMLVLGWMPASLRLITEIVFVLFALAAAVAVRRRWAFNSLTFVLLAAGIVVDEVSRTLPDPALGAKFAAAAFAIFMLGLIRLVLEGIDEVIRRRGGMPLPTIFKDLMMLVIWAAVLLAVLYEDFGIKPWAIGAGIGGLGVAVGFALQEPMRNFFNGITLQMGAMFKAGDWIKSGDFVGRVCGIRWRTTTIITRAGERVEIPNLVVTQNALLNYTTGGVRDEVALGIGYGVAPNHVRKVALTLLHDVPEVMRDPAPLVMAWQYGDFAIQYRIRYWISDYGALERVRDRVVSSLWYALRRHLIEIPNPIQIMPVAEARANERADAGFERELMAELRQVDILHDLGDDKLHVLVPSVSVRQFGAGEMLVRQGDGGESMYIIRSGTVEVLLKTPDGQSRQVAKLGRSQFFGEAALFLGEPRSASVRALTDVEVIEMDREGFTSLFKENPDTASQITEIIAAREAERHEIIAKAGKDNSPNGRRQWLLAKMRKIFDF